MTYTYDALNRLASATSDVNPGWGQSFGYDGFGNNTTQTITKGSAPSLSVTYSASTNRRTTDCADANGNIGSVSNSCAEGYTYDVMNRITAVGSSAYSYSPSNQRVWRNTSATGAEITYYGATGQKLRTFSLSSTLTVTTTGTFYYFGGKLIKNAGGFVTPDRLGSHGKYFPFGQERPSATANNKEKFATYYRDSDTGLDYANNRYHQPGHARFLTPDPFGGSGRTADPGSWNRYAYSGGDPINNSDPTGLDWVYGGDGQWCSTLSGGCQSMGCFDNPAACVMSMGADGGGFGGGGSVFAYDLGHTNPGNFLDFSTAYDVGGPGWDVPMAPSPAPSNPVPPEPESDPPVEHYVTISFWPEGAGGFGHIGIAVDKDDTEGFSTYDPDKAVFWRIVGFPDARLENDIKQHTDPVTGVVQPHSYTRMFVSAASAAAMTAYMESVRTNPGHYNLFFNNCAQFVEDVLHAGGIPGVPHNEIMFPGVLNRMLD